MVGSTTTTHDLMVMMGRRARIIHTTAAFEPRTISAFQPFCLQNTISSRPVFLPRPLLFRLSLEWASSPQPLQMRALLFFRHRPAIAEVGAFARFRWASPTPKMGHV